MKGQNHNHPNLKMNIKRKKGLLDTSFAEIISNQQSTVSYQKKKKNNQQSFLSLGLNAFDFVLQALNFLLAFFTGYDYMTWKIRQPTTLL